MSVEEWRSIPGHPLYEVSDLGRVRSHKRDGEPHVLSPGRTGSGYPSVALSKRPRMVHQLVAEAFIGPRPEGNVIRHLDGDRLNNTRGNLAYGTFAENMLDTVRLGMHFYAKRTACANGHAFSTENTLIRVRNGRPSRACRTCNIERLAARRAAA